MEVDRTFAWTCNTTTRLPSRYVVHVVFACEGVIEQGLTAVQRARRALEPQPWEERGRRLQGRRCEGLQLHADG